MEHALPPLPYAMDALAPHISKETFEYHYGKHHLAYVNKLNELVAMPENAQWKGKSLEQIVLSSTGVMPRHLTPFLIDWFVFSQRLPPS